VTGGSLLTERRILVPLEARTLPDAVRELAAACVADGLVTDPGRLDAVIADAWPEDTLTVGADFFLPHFRTDAVSGVVVALGITKAPIPRTPKARREARGVLLVVAPPREAVAYLQTVAAFARILSDDAARAALFKAKTPADVLAMPAIRELTIEGPLRVADIMTPPPATVSPDTALGQAAAIMLQQELEALPVVDERGEVLGVVSHTELLAYLVPAYVQRVTTGKFMAARKVGGRVITDPRELPVREAMLRNVICVDEHQPVAEAATLMANKHLDHLPVVKGGVLVGIITRAELVRKVIGGLRRGTEPRRDSPGM
jgi:CBS domain-containing protein